MTLLDAKLGQKYTIVSIDTDDEELESFLFTLGCYEGESIVVVNTISDSLVVSIRDGRYNIDKYLGEAIEIK